MTPDVPAMPDLRDDASLRAATAGDTADTAAPAASTAVSVTRGYASATTM